MASRISGARIGPAAMNLGIRLLLHVNRDVLPDEAGHYRALGYQDVPPRNQQTQHTPEDRDTGGLASLDYVHMTADLRSLPDHHSTIDQNVICYLEFHPLAIGDAAWTKGLAEANIDRTPTLELEVSR